MEEKSLVGGFGMKIEMGESLFYSWLRHVKECQIVQTNWKVSSNWELLHDEEIHKLLITIFSRKILLFIK